MKTQTPRNILILVSVLIVVASCAPLPIPAPPSSTSSLPSLPSDTAAPITHPTEAVTPSVEPTATSTPTLTPCEFCPVVTEPNEITICSKDSAGPAGVRAIARWLAQGKKGFYVAAQDSMNISSVRFSGWDPRIDGRQFTFESTEDSGQCGYPATWNRWWDPDSSNPTVGSKVTVEFVNIDGRIVVTVNLTVAESELILDNYKYEP